MFCTIMLKEIMTAGGKDNNDFKYELRTLERKLDKKLLEIRHKSWAEQERILINEELDVQTILEICKDEYRKQLKISWDPAVHARDSKAISRNYGTVNLADHRFIRRMLPRSKLSRPRLMHPSQWVNHPSKI